MGFSQATHKQRGKEAGKSAFSPHQKTELIALSKGIFLSNLG